MWSLPDIDRLNEQAEKNAKRKQRDPLKGQECSCCGKNAEHIEEFFDIFGDKPKGHIYRCEGCNEEGGIPDGYFYCTRCNKIHIENYTWELYKTESRGDEVCLNCALNDYLGCEENWIRKGQEVDMTLTGLDTLPHLIPVSGRYHKKRLKLVGNVEFDSMNGRQISGDSLSNVLGRAFEKSRKAVVIMDGAYQFAVSFGVYVPA